MASDEAGGSVSATDVAAPPSLAPPYAVGIGASAGGLDALRKLFSTLPASPGMSFVVVVHLSPEHESHLVHLLQPYTAMPVRQVTETCVLEPNHVYVIPPNANLSAIDTHLRLAELEPRRVDRAPIDHFFRTLAAVHDGCSIGVVLTGGGSDGALGLRRIKENGGLTVVQDPNEAECDGMPRSAIATGMVDIVAPLAEIGNEILRFCATAPRLPIPGHDGGVDEIQAALLAQIEERLRVHTGRDITVFKRDTLLRRIKRRMKLCHVETLAAYLAVLTARPSEPRALADDLVAGVTEFFREPVVFDRLEREVIPHLFETKTNQSDRLRVWSIGCSTGEEAYSLAILLLEEASRRKVRPQLQVFATDLTAGLLRRAREALYPREVAAQVSPERLAQFFAEEGVQYRVRPEARDLVVFAEQNVFRDPPYSHLDLIVCRSLLRDLQPLVRRALANVFYHALEPDGVLVVGVEDGLDEPELFVCEDERAGVFRRRSEAKKRLDPLALGPLEHVPTPASLSTAGRGGERELAMIHDRLVVRLAPPSVLVDIHDQVVRYSPGAGRYLRLPGGDPTRDIKELVPESLRSLLRAGLILARAEGQPWRSDAIEVTTDAGARRVALRIEPADVPDRPGLLVIAFEEHGAPRAPPRAPLSDSPAIDTIAQLEEDLARANIRLRALIEADERNESLTTSQEDLQSANEELRFILEELEGSKEELTAANEELKALDLENRHRIDELAELSGDLKHLLESTGVGTLFLDRELNIVRFTPQIAELFRVQHTDRARPLSDIAHSLRYDELAADVRGVLEYLAPAEREVESKDGRWYLTRMLPYRTAADTVDGVVVTFIDITDRKQAEQKLRDADRRKDEFLALLAHELRNPLAPIIAGIELLKAAGSDPRVVAQVSGIMARQSGQLVRLVDDLLDVSRVSGGRLRLQRAPIDLADVIRDAVAAVRPLMDRAGHLLVVDVPDDPIVLDADATRLSQVLGNLLNNAAHYTPKQGRIHLTARVEGDQAVVVVKDNGVGIPDDMRAQVFEMFFQGNEPRTMRNAGLGIGLTLAKSLIEMHGGLIAVASDGIDRGSEFTVRLPLAAAGERRPASPVPAASAGLAGHRILLVDDNADAVQTLSLLLQTFGDNEVHTASSGREGLEIAYHLKPDIVLLDLKMPGMDGYEVARRLRQQPGGRAIRVVALSGWGQEEHKRRTHAAGFDGHLTKPASRAALEAVLAGPLESQEPVHYAS